MLHACGVRAVLTPEMRERAQSLLDEATDLVPDTKGISFDPYEYIGLCRALKEFLKDLLDCRAGGAADNPMFETGKET